YDAKIITNDFNLNKVATLQGIEILNVNQLANALKPVVLPGEIMRVFILREGKEYNQGIAYLDDGTMVVVDGARKMINKTIDISVTSVHQTTAGKMIFGRFDDRSEQTAHRPAQGTAAPLESGPSRPPAQDTKPADIAAPNAPSGGGERPPRSYAPDTPRS
ncbi:MAG: TRAM domain-containing protein, partial [Candidatus Acidiferrales bacterium]